MFPLTSSWETLRLSGNKIHCSPRDQSLSVKYNLFVVIGRHYSRSVGFLFTEFLVASVHLPKSEKWMFVIT